MQRVVKMKQKEKVCNNRRAKFPKVSAWTISFLLL